MKITGLWMLMTVLAFSACQRHSEMAPGKSGEIAKSETAATVSQDIPEGVKIITVGVTGSSASVNLYMYQPITIVWGDGQQEYVPKHESRNHTYTDGLSAHTVDIYEMGATSTIIDFGCDGSGITSLDISNCSELETLELIQGNLASLDLSHNPLLNWLYCPEMNLESLDLSHNPLLGSLDCQDNSLKALDVSHNPKLQSVLCNNNPFVSDTASLAAFARTLPNRTGLTSGNLYLDNATAASSIQAVCAAKNWKVR